MALAELLLILAQNHGQMRKDGHVPAQGAVEQDLLGRVGDVVLPADDVGHGHQVVVDDHSVVVGGHPVALDDDDVLQLVRVPLLQPVAHDLHAAVDHVVKGQVLPRLHPEQHGLAIAVGLALVDELLRVFAVEVQALGLAVGAVVPALVRALVPVQAKPGHAVHDGLLVFLCGTREVRVLDAEDELSARVPGPEPVEQGRVPAADVQRPRGAWSEPHAHVCILVCHETPTP